MQYISERFLPDKAIDLVDEAASTLRLLQESKPEELETLERSIITLQIERESLKNDTDPFSLDRVEAIDSEIDAARVQAAEIERRWKEEKDALEKVKDMKLRLEDARLELEAAQR